MGGIILEVQAQQRALAASILAIEQEIGRVRVASQQPCDLSRFDREIASKSSNIESNQRECKIRREKIASNEATLSQLIKTLSELSDLLKTLQETPSGMLLCQKDCAASPIQIGPGKVNYTIPVEKLYTPHPRLSGSIQAVITPQSQGFAVQQMFRIQYFISRVNYGLSLEKLNAEINQLRSSNLNLSREVASVESDIARLSGDIAVCRAQRGVEEQTKIRQQQQLLRENEVRQQQLTVKQAEHKASAERERAAAKEIEQLTIELEVNRTLLELVYETSRTLDLGGIPPIARFWEQYDIYRRRHPLPVAAAAAPPGGPPLVPGFAALALAAPPLAPQAPVPAPAAAAAAGVVALRRV